MTTIGSFCNGDGEQQKNNRFTNWQKKHLCTCITLFCTFLSRLWVSQNLVPLSHALKLLISKLYFYMKFLKDLYCSIEYMYSEEQ